MQKNTKITMKKNVTFEGIFADFIMTRKAKGLSDKTITTYNQHFRAISKHIDINNPIESKQVGFRENDCKYA